MNPDYRDILAALLAQRAEFVVVGAFALAAHGITRATLDFDILVRPSPENAAKVVRALTEFGAPLDSHSVTADDLARPGTVYQLGLPPRRIDILTAISGVSFEECQASRLERQLGDLLVPFLGYDALLRNKRASGRPKDLADVARLEQARPPDAS